MLKERPGMNGISYEYFYNGSGLAVGDFNNDGWEDIYFVSTLGKNKLYLNEQNMQFRDVTDLARADGGVGFDSGVTTVDINADGLLDIYVCRTGRFEDENQRRNVLLINLGVQNGVPMFEEKAATYGLDDPSFSTQAGFFDYDRDGDLDMFLINHGIDNYPDESIKEFIQTPSTYRGERLFCNDQGLFQDVTGKSGIVNNMLGYGLGLAFGDLNNDGWPDIYVSNDFSGQDHLYINQQNGIFKEIAKKATRHISNFAMGNDIADFNNDGWLDIITVDMMAEDNYGIKTSMSGMNPARFFNHVEAGLHYQYMYNTLQMSIGVNDQNEPLYSEIAQISGVSNTDWSWAPLFVDVNNDGLKDLFISNGIKRDFRNNDFVNYRKKMTTEFNQGKLAMSKAQFEMGLISQMPTRRKENYFYLNKGNLAFEKIELADSLKIMTNSNGAAYADFDNDGDLDMVVNNADDFSFIYQNETQQFLENHYLKLQLKGKANNLNGVGARIELSCGGVHQIVEHYTTRGFQSAVSNVIHFGLGNQSIVDKLKITWPDGTSQELHQVKADQLMILEHGMASRPVTPKPTETILEDVTSQMGLHAVHKENDYNDFLREELLPHRQSTTGPALAVSDINNDGLDDFYLGGAATFSGGIYLQQPDGSFAMTNRNLMDQERQYEDVGAIFFDVDNDKDLDLYVVSGGSEFDLGHAALKDRLYLNTGNGIFNKADQVLPDIRLNGSKVAAIDYDRDGDKDLIVGGRLVPGKYPMPADSYILRNDTHGDKVQMVESTTEVAPMLKGLGMVTDIKGVDINSDGWEDLLIAGEWMYPTLLINDNGLFEENSNTGLESYVGWWYSVETADMDGDGDQDIIAGNLGLNYKYKASPEEPFEVYLKDFDDNGKLDIVLGYYDQGKLFPLRGRECSSNQVPVIKEKFETYNDFGNATLLEVYGAGNVKSALHYQANTFASTYFQQNDDGTFTAIPLPEMAQLSSVNDIVVEDFNGDAHLDLIVAGNLYGSEVETPRNDASYGMLLLGDGRGGFKAIPAFESGLRLEGEVKSIGSISLPENETGHVFAKNQGKVQLVRKRGVVQ